MAQRTDDGIWWAGVFQHHQTTHLEPLVPTCPRTDGNPSCLVVQQPQTPCGRGKAMHVLSHRAAALPDFNALARMGWCLGMRLLQRRSHTHARSPQVYAGPFSGAQTCRTAPHNLRWPPIVTPLQLRNKTGHAHSITRTHTPTPIQMARTCCGPARLHARGPCKYTRGQCKHNMRLGGQVCQKSPCMRVAG